MKKIVAIMSIMLVSMVTLSTTTSKDHYHLVVEGSFLADKNVHYTVYKQTGTGAFEIIEQAKAHKYYYVECNTGSVYIIRFENKKGDVKFLMIDASTYGYFQADVDWNKPYDGVIKKQRNGYCLTALTNGDRPALIAQK